MIMRFFNKYKYEIIYSLGIFGIISLLIYVVLSIMFMIKLIFLLISLLLLGLIIDALNNKVAVMGKGGFTLHFKKDTNPINYWIAVIIQVILFLLSIIGIIFYPSGGVV